LTNLLPRLQATPGPSLSIVVPLFNEEENLPELAQTVFDVLGERQEFVELLLIDDGSQDRTAQIATDIAARDSRVRLVKHERNRGLGAAMRTGFAAARGELILYTDADLPFDLRLIPEIWSLGAPDTIVAGCRSNRGEGPRRWLLSRSYNILCRMLLGLDVQDVNFACKLIPRRALRLIQLASEGSFIDAELLIECRRQGMTIREFPMTYYPRVRGISTLSRPRVIIGILFEMLRYLVRRETRPVVASTPVESKV
jgi:glycosyltransferase involved in cell wall biosynthesis